MPKEEQEEDDEKISASESCSDFDSGDEKDEPIEKANKASIRKQIDVNIHWDDRIKFTRHLSKATCNVDEIQSFTFGGGASRFWLLRKHINSMPI